MKVDCWLCQPAGTSIPTQIGCRLGVTFIVDVETDILRPVHVSVERGVTRLADVQPTFNTLIIVFFTTDATRLARVALGHFHDSNSLNLRLVRENLREAVERPPVQVKIAVLTPVLRLAVLILSNTSESPDVDVTDSFLDTPLDDVLRQGVEEMRAALRPFLVQTSGILPTRVVAVGDFFREVVAVLFQAVAGVEVGFLGAVCDGGEVTDAEVNTRRLVAGGVGRLDFVFADEVKFPSPLRFVVDGANLLQILDLYAGTGFVFDKDVFPRFRVFLVIRAFRKADTVVCGVVFDAVLLPRHRTARVFFVDATALFVVVVLLAVAGRIRSIIGLSLTIPRVEGFSELLQNALTGLAM